MSGIPDYDRFLRDLTICVLLNRNNEKIIKNGQEVLFQHNINDKL